jgi:hypothetical protein
MGSYVSLIIRNNHDKQKHFLICESCFWCASSIMSSILFASVLSLKKDKTISRCPVCDRDKISVLPFFLRGMQI